MIGKLGEDEEKMMAKLEGRSEFIEMMMDIMAQSGFKEAQINKKVINIYKTLNEELMKKYVLIQDNDSEKLEKALNFLGQIENLINDFIKELEEEN